MSYIKYFFILLLCAILFPGFAQLSLDVNPCNGGDIKPSESQREMTEEERREMLINLFNKLIEDNSVISDYGSDLDFDPQLLVTAVNSNPWLFANRSRIDDSPSSTAVIRSEAPKDPNEIIGLEGYDAEGSEDTMRWVAATQHLAYTIYFENDPALATASASKVTITLPLHEKLNYGTFGVGGFGFGNHVFAVEGSPSSYQKRIDLRDSLGIYVDVVAGLDIVRHEAFWIFQSIDPATGLPPTDIHSGFLPINDSLHSGEGYVSFTIKPKTTMCITGDTVTAKASIVFDINEPIPTNTWLHTIDAVAPTSSMTAVPNTAGDALIASFTGQDDEGGCGIEQYKLYYSVNNNAYQLYAVYPVGDTAEIPMETGVEYRFFVLAEDHVGNCEPMKSQPEYTIGTNFVTLAVNSFPAEAGLTTGAGTYSMNATAELTAAASEGYHFVNWMNQGVPVSTQNPYTVEVTQNQTYTAYFERNAYTLQTLAAAGSSVIVTDLNGNEVPSGSTIFHADKLIVSVDTADCYSMESVLLNGTPYLPGDTLTVEGDLVLSTTTESMFAQTDTMATVCESFTWYGITYMQSGDYTKTLTAADGCDSVVTLHLTVKQSETAEYAETVCDSYTWNDSFYAQSGDYVQTFTNTEGCDSVVTLHLTVNYSNTGDTTAVACDNFTWHGTTYTESGNYPLTMTNAAGCDSVVTLHLTIKSAQSAQFADTACDSYEWNGTTYTQSGDYSQTFTAENGCDSIVTLHLTVNSTATTEDYLSICESELPYHYSNGLIDTTFEVGTAELLTLNYYLLTESGCDSIVTFHLTVEPTDSTEFAITTDSCYVWNGLAYCASGDYTQIIQNSYGCDSVVTLHLTVTVGIDGYGGFDIVLYPNPAKKILNVQCTLDDVCGEDATVELLDVYGKLLQTFRMSPEITTLNVSGLSSGVYFVRVTTERGMVTKPFVKK